MNNTEDLGEARSRLVQVRGNPYERGLMQAEVFRSELEACAQSLLDLELGPPWLPRPVQRRVLELLLRGGGGFYYARHRALLERYAEGQHLELVRGLAAGFGVSASWLYGFHALEIESTHLGYSLGCTALGFAAEQTVSRQPQLSYNHDFPPAFAPFLFVRETEPTAAGSGSGAPCGARYRSLALSYATVVGAIAGVNERGLALCINQAYATDLSRVRPGLFISMLAQECLDRCATVAEAIELLCRRPVTNGSIVTLVDASGARAAVELSGRAVRVRRAEAGCVLATFNKYRHPDMVAREVPVGAVTTGLFRGIDVHRCNLTRQRRFDELMCDSREYDDADIRALMGDHDGGQGDPNSICRHDDPLGGETIASALIEPRSAALNVMFDHPCRGTYQRYELRAG